eukprot:15364913-Ditylum_brightwellii.AAC.1
MVVTLVRIMSLDDEVQWTVSLLYDVSLDDEVQKMYEVTLLIGEIIRLPNASCLTYSVSKNLSNA